MWHWPVLAFARYSFIDLNVINGLLLFVLMFTLSVASYFWVENRFRNGGYNFGEAFTKLSLVPAFLTACVLIVSLKLSGFLPVRNWTVAATEIKKIEDIKPAFKYSDVLQVPRLKRNDFKSGKYLINKDAVQTPKVLLWGDSNAAQYVGLFKEFAKAGNFSFRNVSSSACPPIIGDIDELLVDKIKKNCLHNRLTIQSQLEDFDIIIMAGSWQAYRNRGDVADKLENTISRLTEEGKQIMLILQMQRMEGLNRSCGARAVINPIIACEKRFHISAPTIYPVNDDLREIAVRNSAVTIIDPNIWICPDGECNAYNGNQIMYFDDGHIGYEAGQYMAKRALDANGFPPQLKLLDRRTAP